MLQSGCGRYNKNLGISTQPQRLSPQLRFPSRQQRAFLELNSQEFNSKKALFQTCPKRMHARSEGDGADAVLDLTCCVA